MQNYQTSGTLVGAQTATSNKVEERAIPQTLSDIQAGFSQLEQSLDQLSARIAPVTTCAAPAQAGQSARPQASTQIGEVLFSFRDRLASLVDQIRDLEKRVQL